MYFKRQVGFDEAGRPVIYSCFSQADTHKNSVEDSITHCTYLIENAKRTMKPGVTTWVFIIDCSGTVHISFIYVCVYFYKKKNFS